MGFIKECIDSTLKDIISIAIMKFQIIGSTQYYLHRPSIYAMKHLIKHFNITKRLLFFFDFHGHPSLKGSFMYGNAID